MTRTHALKRLLEHGPLTRQEIAAIMGGNKNTALTSLRRLVARGEVVRLPAQGSKPTYGVKYD